MGDGSAAAATVGVTDSDTLVANAANPVATPDNGGAVSTPASPKTVNPGGNYLAMGLTATGGIATAVSDLTAGKANKRIADANASIAMSQAQEAEEAGNFAAGRASLRGQQVAATDRAAEAAGGTVAGAGSGGIIAAQNEATSQVDALMIRRNAEREALGLTTKAGNDEIEGDLAQEKGEQGAVSTLLNTGSQAWLESDPNYGGFRGRGLNWG